MSSGEAGSREGQECLGESCRYFHTKDAALCFTAGFLPHCGYELRKAKRDKCQPVPTELTAEDIKRFSEYRFKPVPIGEFVAIPLKDFKVLLAKLKRIAEAK